MEKSSNMSELPGLLKKNSVAVSSVIYSDDLNVKTPDYENKSVLFNLKHLFCRKPFYCYCVTVRCITITSHISGAEINLSTLCSVGRLSYSNASFTIKSCVYSVAFLWEQHISELNLFMSSEKQSL